MTPLMSDISLFFKKHPNGDLSGMLGAYVDDAFMGGDNSFQVLSKKMLRRIQAKERTLNHAEFVGVRVSTIAGGERLLALDQEDYSNNLANLPLDAPFTHYLSRRASVAWLVLTRPDLCYGVNQAVQITASGYGPLAIKSLNRLVRRAKVGRILRLHFPPLDRSTLRLRVYSDSSFANNADQSSQIGYVVLLCNGSGRAHVLSFTSRKCRRVVRSIMAVEVYAFSEAFDEAFIIRYDLERLYGQHIPLNILTDCGGGAPSQTGPKGRVVCANDQLLWSAVLQFYDFLSHVGCFQQSRLES